MIRTRIRCRPLIDAVLRALPFSAGLVLLVLNCTTPFVESPRVEPGLTCSLNGGVGRGTWWTPTASSHFVDPMELTLHNFYAVYGGCQVSYGVNNRLALLLRGAAGYPVGSYEAPGSGTPWLLEVQMGGKVRLGDRGALYACTGMPGLLEVGYVHALSDWASVGAALGSRGVSVSLGLDPAITERLRTRLNVSAGFPSGYLPSLNLGLGLEWLMSDRKDR